MHPHLGMCGTGHSEENREAAAQIFDARQSGPEHRAPEGSLAEYVGDDSEAGLNVPPCSPLTLGWARMVAKEWSNVPSVAGARSAAPSTSGLMLSASCGISI